MLPPVLSVGITVEPSRSAGATPRQPIIGATGQSRVSVSCTRPFRTGIRRTKNSGPIGRASAPAPGMKTDHPCSASSMAWMVTASTSPGSAPVTWTGPVIGLMVAVTSLRSRNSSICAYARSSVSKVIRSPAPAGTVSTGGREAEKASADCPWSAGGWSPGPSWNGSVACLGRIPAA